MKENYDAVIIGGGIGGLMCAYRLAEKKPDMHVLIPGKEERNWKTGTVQF